MVGKGRRVTIPREVLAEAKIAEGQALAVECTPEGVLLRPVEERDPDQWWFWTEEWQAGEREVDAERDAGLGTLYLDDDEFIRSLEARLKPLDE
jgi:bifunctional DNA-binding transcriptional regulator/antitoxin component of YhaV-PrlF toxin-antitoxin module